MKIPTFISHEPAVWIALVGALLVLLVNSGVVPVLAQNQVIIDTAVTLIVGAVIRAFVTPTVKVAALK